MRARLFPGRGRAAKEARNADVFVDVRPVNAKAITEKFKVPALGLASAQQSWKPGQGHGEAAAIRQHDDQFVVGYLNFMSPGMCFNA